MNFEEWIESIQYKLKEKYKIKKLYYTSDFGLRIDFSSGFHYSIEKDILEGYYIYSISEIQRTDDGLNDICYDIERLYMQQLKR